MPRMDALEEQRALQVATLVIKRALRRKPLCVDPLFRRPKGPVGTWIIH
jgi:hypothetical protein